MNVVSVESVTKRYGSALAVNSVSFSIGEGCIFGLLGPNGAGKTSTIRMLNLITLPDSGTIELFSESQKPEHQNRIGYMPEERGLYRKLPVREQLEYLGALRGLSTQQLKKNIDYWLERFEIENWAKKKTGELSKGMQQKLQFIAALLHDPDLYILDEPLSGLDPINADITDEIILELRAKGKTIILSTHRMEQVEQLCDEIALMNLGSVVIRGSLRDVKQHSGKKMVKFIFDGDDAFVSELSHFPVRIAERHPNELLVEMLPSSSTRELLQYLSEKTNIVTWQTIETPLKEIFLEAINGNPALSQN
ncbi:MAG TPA: ATP-binding cassette domain-containing protein [Candidatus Kapabacteria bacterium]|nr:ATP-binding cassette domain-containing protein [Candidatus Kapabacteria bacterium]